MSQSRHEGVSCDSCLKGNFRGRRYKCLVCYDYDLCATCYEAGSITTRHTIDHPMQCILTHADFELYYGGEALPTEQQQAFTCPMCGLMGYTEATLMEHVNTVHTDANYEVVCPICAAQPGGEPNMVTEDLSSHLTITHGVTNQRDLISFLDEGGSSAIRHTRRIPHSARGIGSSRGRRIAMNLSSNSGGVITGGAGGVITGGSNGTSAAATLSTRDGMDPIAELLSQLSGVRRTPASGGSASVQLQQLQMQLQLERQQVRAARQQLERIPRARPAAGTGGVQNTTASSLSTSSAGAPSSSHPSNPAGFSSRSSVNSALIESNDYNSLRSLNVQDTMQKFLISSKLIEGLSTETDLQTLEIERADHSLFMREIVLTTLAEKREQNTERKKQTASQQCLAVYVPESLMQPEQASVTKRATQQKTSAQIQKSVQQHQQHQQASQPRSRSSITSSNNLVLLGSDSCNNDTRRKPLCPLDAINNKSPSEPPASR